jgi:hypothetical protein
MEDWTKKRVEEKTKMLGLITGTLTDVHKKLTKLTLSYRHNEVLKISENIKKEADKKISNNYNIVKEMLLPEVTEFSSLICKTSKPSENALNKKEAELKERKQKIELEKQRRISEIKKEYDLLLNSLLLESDKNAEEMYNMERAFYYEMLEKYTTTNKELYRLQSEFIKKTYDEILDNKK